MSEIWCMCIPRGKKIGIKNLLSMALMELIRMDIYCVWRGEGRFYSPMGKWNWIFLRWLGSSWNWDRILQIDLGHVNYEYCLCYLASCQTLVDELWTYKGALTEWGMIAVMLLAEIIYYWQRKRSPCIIWQFGKKKKKKFFRMEKGWRK